MKALKTFLAGLIMFCITSPFATAVSDGNTQVTLTEKQSSDHTQHRIPSSIPITCYIMSNDVAILSSSPMPDVMIALTDSDRGITHSYVTALSDIPFVISVPLSGHYDISFTTPYGHSYEGHFEIE